MGRGFTASSLPQARAPGSNAHHSARARLRMFHTPARRLTRQRFSLHIKYIILENEFIVNQLKSSAVPSFYADNAPENVCNQPSVKPNILSDKNRFLSKKAPAGDTLQKIRFRSFVAFHLLHLNFFYLLFIPVQDLENRVA
jgi:hypothetical protein